MASVVIHGKDEVTGFIEEVKTLNGALLISGGGGGGGGDASSANQTLQLNQATASNLAICTRLDTSNVAQFEKLNLITEATEQSAEYLQGILTKSTPLQIYQSKFLIDAVPSLAPDTSPAFTIPPSSIPLTDGWYFKNTGLSQPSQIYYYSWRNPAGGLPARQKTYTLGDVSGGYCVVRMFSVNATAGLVTLGIYSQPTGSGDAVPGFYKSRKVFNIPAGSLLTQGQKVLLYWGLPPDSRIHPDLTRIECTLATTTGTALPTENLAYLTLQTDSASLAGDSEYCVSACGWIYGAQHIHDTTLSAESQTEASAGDASSANQTLQLNQATASNLAICERLDKYTFTNGNLYVYDQTTNATVGQCLTELSSLSSTIEACTDGTSQLYVRIDGTEDAIQMWGYNPTLAMPEAIYTNDNAMKCYVDNVADVLLLAKNNVDNNVYLKTDASQNLLTSVQGSVAITTASHLDVNCYGSSDGVVFHHLKTNPNGVLSTNAIMETDANGALTSTAVSGTEIYNALDVKVRGSTSVTGSVTSTLSTADYGSLTSTLSGTGNSVHSLDVAVKNSVSVQNVSSSQLDVKSSDTNPIITAPRNVNFTQVATNLPSVFGPNVLGSVVDTQGYLYINALIKVGSVSSSGSVVLEFSPDGVIWGRAFYSAFFNTGGASQQLITVSNPLPWRYVRLYADSGVGLATINAWISMK